jgi:hypothetical protein
MTIGGCCDEQFKYKSLSGEKVEHSNKGVLITATEEITVFGVNKDPTSTDGFVSFPTDSPIQVQSFLLYLS